MKATEELNRFIHVQHFWIARSETVELDSVEAAIDEVKSPGESPQPSNSKILIDDEVVYFDERHGSIETWEKEWRRQKRKQSLSESAHQCPYSTDGCYRNDLCMECTLDKAKSQSYQ